MPGADHVYYEETTELTEQDWNALAERAKKRADEEEARSVAEYNRNLEIDRLTEEIWDKFNPFSRVHPLVLNDLSEMRKITEWYYERLNNRLSRKANQRKDESK